MGVPEPAKIQLCTIRYNCVKSQLAGEPQVFKPVCELALHSLAPQIPSWSPRKKLSTSWDLYSSGMGSASAMSTKHRDHQRTHTSGLLGLHTTLSHMGFDPICVSYGKSSGVSCRCIFLNKINCCPSLQRATRSLCRLRDLLLTPALASPTTT